MNKLTNDQAYWLDQLWYGVQGRDGKVTDFSDLWWEDLFFMSQNVLVDGRYNTEQKQVFNKVREMVLNKKIVLDLEDYEASDTSWLAPYCDND